MALFVQINIAEFVGDLSGKVTLNGLIGKPRKVA